MLTDVVVIERIKFAMPITSLDSRKCASASWTIQSLGVFDWSSSVTYVLTDWTFLTILYSTGTGNEAM